ncbi:MAG TPA: FG-GAP-like repeat-containing protein, partial [Candidatus Eisenbacteria bacterium]
MKTPSLGLSFALLFFTATSPASAQYIYLDSNADGVHTAADQLHAVGPTVVDIWLDTGHNRDGSATVCAPAPATPMNMFSYEASLEANGGTVVFSSYTNRVAQMGPLYPPHAPDGTRFATGPFATPVGAVLAPGKYQLGTVTVNVLSGMPSIRFVPTINDFGSYTLFGSFCDGTDYLNSIVLGTDFFDADGLPYGTGGTPNRAPTLSPPANMTVSTGENAVQPITATDPDGQLLTFAKISGPGFLTVSTTDQGAGTAHGEIRLTPFASDTGTATGSVGVSDGTESDQATFSIEVAAAPNHLPFVFPTPRLTVVAGEVGNLPLNAGDPDGGTLHFAKAAGPAYVRVRELVTGSGGASAVLTASPTLCDAGTAIATVSVSDGVSQGQRQVEVSVVPPSAPPDSIVRHFSYGPPGLAIAVGSGDMNGDGNIDVVAADSERGTLSVLLGRGDGSLSPAVSYPIAAAIPVSLAIADLDRDGHLDVAVPSYGGASVSVLLGRGDGTFLPRAFYDTGSGPYGVAAADLNRDGILDLVTSNQNSGTVSVLVGMGDGTFAANRDVPAGLKPSALAVGDFNLDGRPDVVVA